MKQNTASNFKSILTLTAGLSATAFIFNCSGAGTSGSTGGGGGGTGLSSYASALAEDLVMVSPTAQRTAGSILSTGPRYFEKDGVFIMSGPNADDSPKEKSDALETLLAATAPASCNIALNLQNAGRANCYGPNVNYTNHEFDDSTGQYPGGDLGIWVATDPTTSEACSASQLNAQMKGVISYVDTAQFIAAGMACVANKAGKSFPSSAGTSVDLTADMSGVVTVNAGALNVTAATIARDADDGSGNPVYVTTLTGTVGTKTVDVRVKHVSTTADDSTNKGKISVKITDSSGPGSTDGVSLQYEKVSSSVARFLLKSVNFNNSAAADPYVGGGNYSVDLTTMWSGNANFLKAEIDPSKYTGNYQYAWQAGNGDSHARVFNAVLSESGGNVSGKTFFGFGPRMQTGPGTIDGMICNWAGPGNNHSPVTEVQREDIALNGSGKFEVSGTTKITFDPVADCEANTSGTTMAMSWNIGGVSGSSTVDLTTKDLAPLTDVSSFITAPTAPADVD